MFDLPILKTKRLMLREIEYSDADDMYSYAKNPLVGPSAGWAPHHSLDETLNIISTFIKCKTNGEPGVYAIIEQTKGKMIGTIELFNVRIGHKAELGYALSPEYWGQGIIVEAANALMDYGFQNYHLKRIEASTFIDNQQSIRVCEKLGFIFEGIARNGYLRYDGKIIDKRNYGITDLEFYARLANQKQEEN